MTQISPSAKQQKPPRIKGSRKLPARKKLIHIDPPDLALIERAAKSQKPRPFSANYYIVQAAAEKARRELGISA